MTQSKKSFHHLGLISPFISFINSNILLLLSFTCQEKSELNFIFYKTLRTEKQGDVFQEEGYGDEKVTGEMIY